MAGLGLLCIFVGVWEGCLGLGRGACRSKGWECLVSPLWGSRGLSMDG